MSVSACEREGERKRARLSVSAFDCMRERQREDICVCNSPMNTLLLTNGCAASRLMHTITNEGPKSDIT